MILVVILNPKMFLRQLRVFSKSNLRCEVTDQPELRAAKVSTWTKPVTFQFIPATLSLLSRSLPPEDYDSQGNL